LRLGEKERPELSILQAVVNRHFVISITHKILLDFISASFFEMKYSLLDDGFYQAAYARVLEPMFKPAQCISLPIVEL